MICCLFACLHVVDHQISYTIYAALTRAVKKVAENYIGTENEDKPSSYPIQVSVNERKFGKKESAHHLFSSWFSIDNLKVEKPVYGEETSVFTNFMAPGIALSVIFFMSVASTASNFVLERRLGLTERSFLAGVRTLELLLSQLVVYSALMLVQVLIIICLLFGVLQLPLKGSLLLLVLLIYSQGFCGLCYGLCLASIIHCEETVIQVTLASFYPVLLLSGIIWPIEAQPMWLKTYVSQFSPLTYASDASRAILEKSWSLTEWQVARGFIATYMWTLAFAVCFLVMFSRRFRILS